MMYVMSSSQALGTNEVWIQRHPVLTTIIGGLFWAGVFTVVAKFRRVQQNPEQLGLWSEQQERAIRPGGARYIVKRRKPEERSSGGRFRWTKWEKRSEHETLEGALDAAKDYSKHPWRWRYAVFHKGKQLSDYDRLKPAYRHLRGS
jgi:hypothetical protein